MFAYRLVPQSTTGVTLAELLLGQKPHSRLDLIKPDMAKRVEDKQLQQKATHDVSAHSHTFEDGDLVHVLNFALGEKWIPGKIYRLRDLYLFVSSCRMVTLWEGIRITCNIEWWHLNKRVLRQQVMRMRHSPISQLHQPWSCIVSARILVLSDSAFFTITVVAKAILSSYCILTIHYYIFHKLCTVAIRRVPASLVQS